MSTATDQAGLVPPRRLADRPGPPHLVNSSAARWMSLGLAAVAVAAAALTLLAGGILNGPPAMNGSARGTAAGMLLLGVPLLLGSQIATRRQVSAALPVWVGAIAFLLYNAFMLLFATPFNSLFLLYVATFSLALWSLVALLRVVDIRALGRRIRPGAPVRVVAVFTWVVVALNAAAWLRAISAGMADTTNPAFLAGTGLTTAPTYVQDLAVWLPLMAVAAFWLWRGLAWGYLVVAAVLTTWVVESLTIAADQYLGALADPASPAVSSSMSPLFVGAAVVTAVPAVVLLRRM